MQSPFGGYYLNRTVLVTGDSGFKGAWLAAWLRHLGAHVVGYSLDPPTQPSTFESCRLNSRITHITGDIRDPGQLLHVFNEYRPETVFHLAAQPLVRLSYAETRYTFEANVMGTINVLEASRNTASVRSLVSISSDKCYRNTGADRGYIETDPLGGYDPYSASKACAEIVLGVYMDPRFQKGAEPPLDLPIASARAGNVIGGGDWAMDRIVPDIVRAIVAESDVVLRSPDAVRPWQHVLEPLSAYLWLGARIAQDRRLCGPWNFGPDDQGASTVEEITAGVLQRWPGRTRLVIQRDESKLESKMLRLDCSKAAAQLNWIPAWNIAQTLDATVVWYKRFYDDPDQDMLDFTLQQIDMYTRNAMLKEVVWAGTPA